MRRVLHYCARRPRLPHLLVGILLAFVAYIAGFGVIMKPVSGTNGVSSANSASTTRRGRRAIYVYAFKNRRANRVAGWFYSPVFLGSRCARPVVLIDDATNLGVEGRPLVYYLW